MNRNLNNAIEDHGRVGEISEMNKKSSDDEDLLKSARYYNFDDKYFNEYVSSGEDEEEEKKECLDLHDDAVESDIKRSNSIIFKAFKPGQVHAAFNQIPQSHAIISPHEPLFKKNQRKLPNSLKEKQE